MKKAIFSIDVEDWFHLDYFDRHECDQSISYLDGLDIYVDLINSLSIPSSFFVLGEIAQTRVNYFKNLVDSGHDVGSHGWDHQRPLSMNTNQFREDLKRCSVVMKEINGVRGYGYRAPCFSLDRERLEIVKESNFIYDSSKISFNSHSLYGSLNVSDFTKITDSIYQKDNFFEFEVSTQEILKKNIPISGGGYLRIFPWNLTKELVRNYLKKNDIYVLYIHPFELSQLSAPNFPSSTSSLTKFRFQYGRKKIKDRLEKLVELLHFHGYEFTTFSELQNDLQHK